VTIKKRRFPKTEWGMKVGKFSMQYGIELKRIAELSGVSYSTLLSTMKGVSTGEHCGLLQAVDQFMERYS